MSLEHLIRPEVRKCSKQTNKYQSMLQRLRRHLQGIPLVKSKTTCSQNKLSSLMNYKQFQKIGIHEFISMINKLNRGEGSTVDYIKMLNANG